MYPMVLKLVVLANAVSFFGKEVGKSWPSTLDPMQLETYGSYNAAKDEAFMKSALDHIEQTLLCAEIVRLLPKWLAP